MGKNLLELVKTGKKLTYKQQILLVLQLSIPAILAQISTIIMEYIDASMVGRLGPDASASIGLVSSSTWLLGGLYSALSIGFTVQVAQKIGAGNEKEARNVVKEGLIIALIFSLMLMIVGVGVSRSLPHWLGGEEAIRNGASKYFMIYALFLPVMQINNISAGMIQCSGNMTVPSVLHIIMCVMDVVFNSVLIFESRTVKMFGIDISVKGAGLGVEGAAIGTGLAYLITAMIMMYFLLAKSQALHIRRNESVKFKKSELIKAVRMSVPVGIEQVIMCGAYIMSTKIVAPLGTIAIAAHSFSITAEGLCYMPGYGIGAAATTIIGQSVGAGRKDLTRRLGFVAMCLGMGIMAISGMLMYIFAPYMIGILTPNAQIQALGTRVLRIEAFAEPMYAASIVASGVFRGKGDTFVPSCMNFFSMWIVRIPLSAILATRMGLEGVWIAMCIELCVRGMIFIVRMIKKK